MSIEIDSARYRKILHNSQKVTWDIDADVIRFRQLETDSKFLPDSLSLVTQLPFLNERQQRLLSQIQGRTYAYLFGLIERCINAKMLELGRAHCLGDQTALAALLKFVQEELKHQELFAASRSWPSSRCRAATGCRRIPTPPRPRCSASRRGPCSH